MNDSVDNVLYVTTESGNSMKINVLDIIDSPEFNKEYVLYNVEDNKDNIFASILNEKENSFSLDTISDEKEISYINSKIDEYINQLGVEDES